MKLIVIVFFAINLNLFADETYPNLIKQSEYFDGGRLVIDSTKSIFSYLIKYNIGNQALEIYNWKGLDRKNEKGNSIFASSIVSYYAKNGKLYLLIKENSNIELVEYNSDLIEQKKIIIEKINLQNEYSGKIIESNSNHLYFILNNKLFSVNISKSISNLNLMENNIDDAILFNDRIACITKNESNVIIKFINYNSKFLYGNRLELFENIKLIKDNNFLYVLTSINLHSQTMIHCIDYSNGNILFNDWVESKINHIIIENGKIIRLIQNKGIYSILISKSDNISSDRYLYKENLPENMIEPLLIESDKSDIYIVFRNGIISASETAQILSKDYFPIGEYFQDIPELSFLNKLIIMASDYNTIVFLRDDVKYWYLNKFFSEFSSIIIPTIFLIFAFVFLQLYRHQKRLLNELISLPSVGVIFVLDKSGRLLRANPQGKDFLGLSDSIPKRKFFSQYCNYEHTKPIDELLEKSLKTRQSYTQRININIGDNHKEWLCNTIILSNIAGRFRGIVFTGIDITEQLERNRLSNWAQLAHDMQTNLSTIRLNAEQIDIISENNKSRQKKIFHQVNLLIQRVRDIVTVGRTDKLDKIPASSNDLCLEVRNEFDDLMFPNIQFRTELTDFPIECDKPKLIRALRNAIENAIKAFKGAIGTVTLICYEEDNFACFVIKDNGPGMDEITKKRMLTPYFTTAKSEGGSGIGTMIMQHVTELHGGKITVNSEIGKGTEVIFYIPNVFYKRKPKKIIKSLL